MDANGSEKSNPDKIKQAGVAVTETLKSATTQVRRSISKFLSLKMLVLAVIALIVLHFLSVITIPFAPFTTKGKIYVDSPEVYTRERLVNDRYDQDYWLKQQIDKLDKLNPRLVSETRATVIEGGVGEHRVKQSSAGSNGPAQLTIDQEFHVIAGIRDMIRQQILENMLDDRHDLTGNSVYGLKFDTTVIPGSNTRGRAFVHLNLEVENLFHTRSDSAGEYGDHIKGYIASKVSAINLSGDKSWWRQLWQKRSDDHEDEDKSGIMLAHYREQHGYYLNWLADISKRLNRMEDSVFEDTQNDCLTMGGEGHHDALTRTTLEIVLGIPHERFSALNQKMPEGQMANWVALPSPWATLFTIYRSKPSLYGAEEEKCSDSRVWFDVYPLVETLFPFYKSASRPWLCKQKDAQKVNPAATVVEQTRSPVVQECAEEERIFEIIPVGSVEDGNWIIYIDLYTDAMRSKTLGGENSWSEYEFSSQSNWDLMKMLRPDCDYRNGYQEMDKMSEHCGFQVPSGFFNFAERLSGLDAYSYAIFPKNDVVGVLAETSAMLAGAAAGTGFLGIGSRRSESKTVSVLVGYGDGKGSDPDNRNTEGIDTIAFGWVISARGDMEPTSKNQLALVSVPAWTNELHLTVHTGWLDRESHPLNNGRDKFTVTIPVPPDYEAFDSIFRGDAWVTQGPRIYDNKMDKEISVRAGDGVKILIPGSRLWRSASVTLGAQLATRIRVLPNMEGIIAEFPLVDLPHAAYNDELDAVDNSDADAVGGLQQDKGPDCRPFEPLESRPVRLRVWTSEGVIKARRPVCVYYDPEKIKQGRPQSENTTGLKNPSK